MKDERNQHAKVALFRYGLIPRTCCNLHPMRAASSTTA